MASIAFEIDGTALHKRNKCIVAVMGDTEYSSDLPNDFWREQHQPRPQLLNVHVQIA